MQRRMARPCFLNVVFRVPKLGRAATFRLGAWLLLGDKRSRNAVGAPSAVPRSPRAARIPGAVLESEMDQCEFASVGKINEVARSACLQKSKGRCFSV